MREAREMRDVREIVVAVRKLSEDLPVAALVASFALNGMILTEFANSFVDGVLAPYFSPDFSPYFLLIQEMPQGRKYGSRIQKL